MLGILTAACAGFVTALGLVWRGHLTVETHDLSVLRDALPVYPRHLPR